MMAERSAAYRSYDGLFVYTDAQGHASPCYLQVYEPRGALPIVIATEITENSAVPLTTAVGELATQAWRRLLPHAREGLRLIVVYRESDCGGQSVAEQIAEATLSLDGMVLHSPRWHSLTREVIERLIGGPFSVPIITSGA